MTEEKMDRARNETPGATLKGAATKHTYTVATAFEQLEKCDFECEGGPLGNNTAYRWLKEQLTKGPQFSLGQWVWFEIAAEVSGIRLAQHVRLCVVGIRMTSDTERRTWVYSLSSDPPAPYHYGTAPQFQNVPEKALQPGGTYEGAAISLTTEG